MFDFDVTHTKKGVRVALCGGDFFYEVFFKLEDGTVNLGFETFSHNYPYV